MTNTYRSPAWLISVLAGTIFLAASPEAHASAEMDLQVRLSHAKELMGPRYTKSIVRKGEMVLELNRFIQERILGALKGKHKKNAARVAEAIITESKRYGMDPMFVMAVIENESSFNPEIVGGVGEIGLMQIRPTTAKWVAKKFDIAWKGDQSLFDPVTNVRIGTAYLSMLREKFDNHSRLYVSAYNMGSKNVRRALQKSVWPKEYASRVMVRYVRYYTNLDGSLRSPASH